MLNHEQKVNRIIQQLKSRKGTSPVSLRKKTVSHEVPKMKDQRFFDEKIDVSDLDDIIKIDVESKICIAEPGVTFVDLVKATTKYNLVPIVVPELKTITIGGAISGCSIESMSYMYGGFHDNCLEYEIITAKGDLLICTPDNENSLIFEMAHGTFGTVGIISKIKFRLIEAKPFVKVIYQKFETLEEYKTAIWEHYERKDVDFMDGIIHSPSEYVLSIGNFVNEAPYTHNYNWMRIYYKDSKRRKEDYLKTIDYFFRYDKGVTNPTPKSFLGRLILGRFIGSTELLKLVKIFRRFIPERMIPITLDTFIPFSRATEFFQWYKKEINFFPLWCVPYKIRKKYEWLTDEFFDKTKDELFLDIAIYGMKNDHKESFYKMLEKELMEIGGIKTLISGNYYSESDFWKIWNKRNYDKVKQKTDPDNIFRDLYTKTCKTTRGVDY
ncbi:FAD-binding oxidoreductase [Patescibacteria group bacterium]|nr:FAD-binding oxidoreductase [Patescibacteria group bacterium]MBU1727706.1 FAD-binding oxidoreductase [Patescibacteria group bacterium]